MKKRNRILLYLFTAIITLSINVYADNGCGAITQFVADMNEHLYIPIKWGTPLLFLVLTSFDFAKVVFSGDQKGMDKAKTNFLKRAIAALLIFFAPEIITALAEIISQESITSCIKNT